MQLVATIAILTGLISGHVSVQADDGKPDIAAIVATRRADALPLARKTDEGKPDIATIVAAWTSRATTTDHVEVQLHVVDTKYQAFSQFQNEWTPSDSGGVSPRPAKLVIEGNRIRYDAEAWTYDDHLMHMPVYDYQRHVGDYAKMKEELSAGRFQHALYSHFLRPELSVRDPQSFTSLFDGAQRIDFWGKSGAQHAREILLPKPNAVHEDPRGVYRKIYFQACHDGAFDLDNLVYQPIVMTYRPFESWYGGIDPARCTIESEVLIRGRKCFRLVERTQVEFEGASLDRCFMIDPDRGWIVMRYLGKCGDHPQVQIDIDYEQSHDGEWRPSQWTVMRMDSPDRPIQNFATIQATDYKINQNPSPVNFDVTRPVGTWSIDWQPMTQSLLRADGSKRRILELESDVSAPYEVLMNSEPGQAYFEAQLRSRFGVLRALWRAESLIVFGALLCVVAIIPWKRKSTTQNLVILFVVAFGTVGFADEQETDSIEPLPGLVLTIRSSEKTAMTRASRIAFRLRSDESLHSVIAPDEWSAAWIGNLKTGSPGIYRFGATVLGRFELRIDDRLVLELDSGDSDQPVKKVGEAIDLDSGTVAVQATFTKATGRAAVLSVFRKLPDEFEESLLPASFTLPANVPETTPQEDRNHKVPFDRLELSLKQLRCTDCHERGGDRSTFENRSVVSVDPGGDRTLGDLSAPSLDGVGERLKPDYLRRALLHRERIRPWLNFKLPQYSHEEVEPLVELLIRADGVDVNEKEATFIDGNSDEITAGRHLTGGKGFNCVGCHDFGEHRGTGVRAPDLSTVTDRLHFAWFQRWLHNPQSLAPGTRMPNMFHGGISVLPQVLEGRENTQVLAIWNYLRQREGLIPPEFPDWGSTVIAGGESATPIPTDRPIMKFGFLPEHAGLRAVVVGNPSRLHFAWDTEKCQLRRVWQGAFIHQAGWEGSGKGGVDALAMSIPGRIVWQDNAAGSLRISKHPDTSPVNEASGMASAIRGSVVEFKECWTTGSACGFAWDLVSGDSRIEVQERLTPVPGLGELAFRRTITMSEVPSDTTVWQRVFSAVESENSLADSVVKNPRYVRVPGKSQDWIIVSRGIQSPSNWVPLNEITTPTQNGETASHDIFAVVPASHQRRLVEIDLIYLQVASGASPPAAMDSFLGGLGAAK